MSKAIVNYPKLSIRLTPELEHRLLAFKRRTGISRGFIARQGILMALATYERFNTRIEDCIAVGNNS